MYDLLAGMRIVEGSAFVAAPMGGMTLSQLGADVIRFDDRGGALDGKRWPITRDGESLYWASLNKGKRSLAVDVRKPEGRDILQRLITAPGDDGAVILDFNRASNLPCAFTDFATCPVAPAENRLAVAVEAGEKKPR